MDNLFSAERPFAEWKIQGFDGQPALLFTELESTHRYSKEHLKDLSAGDIIVADSQTSGRGRHDRVWISPHGKNLYFNILYPLNGFQIREYPQLMQITAISLSQLFHQIGVDSSVKWPNDILFEKKKLCGMVSEILCKENQKLLTVGIGIDVNADEVDFQSIERPVTSLKICLGKKLNREILLRQIVESLKNAFEITLRCGITPWIEEWRKMDKFLGHPAKIVDDDESIEGTILDINDDGSLLFCTKSGNLLSRYTGDLEI